MSRYRVYLKPFQSAGVYESEFTEISEDVLKISPIEESLDNTDYDIGVFKNSGVTIDLRNDHGRYAEAEKSTSIFRYKRQDTLIRITWDARRKPLKAGYFKGFASPIGGETTIFEGLLFDVSGVSSIDDQKIKFRFNGYDSLFSKVNVPYSSISNGDTFSEALYTMFNQSEITSYLTVDQANIVCQVDEEIDDKTSLENLTVKKAFDGEKILLCSSSVLYIQNNTVYVSNRAETSENKFTFYGQASINGLENIISIKNYREGVNKIYNFAKWDNTTEFSTSSDSVLKYGIKEIDISSALISDLSTAKIANILDEITGDFSNPKREFILETPVGYDVLSLYLKDKVSVDYPTIYRSADGGFIPRWGQVKWADFKWPFGQYSLTIDNQDRFKIMSRKINPDRDTISFMLRGV